jgi:hypothetical protein
MIFLQKYKNTKIQILEKIETERNRHTETQSSQATSACQQ